MKSDKFLIEPDFQFFARNREVVNMTKTVNTQGEYGEDGLMPPDDARDFFEMIQEGSEFLKQLRFELVTTEKGTLSKLGVGGRLLRASEEGVDNNTGNEVLPIIGAVKYECKDAGLGTSISKKWLRDNKSRENFEEMFIGQIADQIRVDILDLAFNGDTDTPSDDPDVEFLVINDGFIKQIKEKGNVVDGNNLANGYFTKASFFALRKAVPAKYRNPKFRWICSDNTYTDWYEYLSERPTTAGDTAIVKGNGIEVLNTKFEIVPNFPDDVVIYADPANLVVTCLEDVEIEKADKSETSINKRVQYYAAHVSNDFIILEPEATAVLINRGVVTTEDSSVATVWPNSALHPFLGVFLWTLRMLLQISVCRLSIGCLSHFSKS